MFDENIFMERLSTARKRMNLSKRQLAFRIHISPAAMGQFERGVALPTLKTLVSLADALGVTTDWLLGREE